MLEGGDLGGDDDGALEVLDVAELVDARADPPVACEDFAADGASEGHVLEEVVHALEHGVGLVDLLLESELAFFTETGVNVDSAIFVASSDQVNLLRVLDF